MDQVDHSGFNTNLFAPKSDHQRIPRQEMMAKTSSFSSYQPIKPPHMAAVVYKECLKNHAASLGGHALDGCGEFMPLSSDPADLNSMKCAACDCHRNFHRQVTADGRREPPLLPPVIPTSVEFTPPHFSLLPRRFASSPSTSLSPSPSPPLHLNPPPPPPPPPPTAAATLQQYSPEPHMMMALSTGKGTSPPPPDHLNKNRAKPEPYKPIHQRQTRRNQNPNPNLNPNPNSNKNSSAKRKRFRSKFSNEQKEKMRRFAEGLNWKMQRNDEKLVSEFCEEVGVSKGVLKVWMHNNKNTVGKMPRNSNNNNSNHSSSCNNEDEDQQINDNGNDQLGLIDHHHQYNQRLHQHHVGTNGSSCSA